MQHETRVTDMYVLLTRNCVGDDVPKDGISLCVRIEQNGVTQVRIVDFKPGGAGWAEATALWHSVHDEVGGRPVWETVAGKIAEASGGEAQL